MPLLVANVPRQNNTRYDWTVDSVSSDSVAAKLHLQALISDFQISLRHPIPGVRFLQGGADEERQGICK